ncbi:MAG TPA: restriction endonuclease [Candidatus Thermoplasmatota archaeon]|nr:restriction endonuclease [Candidatus Thermoplasmatota archaeon]
MGTVVQLLEELLGRHGYTVGRDADLEGRSGAVYTVPILAEREMAILVTGHLDLSPLPADRVATFAETVVDTGASLGVLVHLGPLSADASAAGQGRVVLWSRDELVRVLGEAQLCGALGHDLPSLPLEPTRPVRGPVVAESVSDLMPSAFNEPEVQLDMTGLDLAALVTSAAEETPMRIPEVEVPAFPPAAYNPPAPSYSPPPAPTFPVAPPSSPRPLASRPLLPVRLDEKEARRKVKDKLFGIDRIELLLQPVHLFDYECDELKEGSLAYDTHDGRVQVNASDKGVLDVDPDIANPEAATLLTANHGYTVTERVVRIPEERALELARQFITRKHVRSVEVKIPDHRNSLMYTERRKVEPTPDMIRVRSLGVHFRPVWRMLGRNGQIDLDAMDGREVFSEVRGGRTDAMVVD